MNKQEAWPGAGLELDWGHLTEEDFKRVEQHVESLPNSSDKRDFLDRLEIELKDRYERLYPPVSLTVGLTRRSKWDIGVPFDPEPPERQPQEPPLTPALQMARKFNEQRGRLREKIARIAEIEARSNVTHGQQVEQEEDTRGRRQLTLAQCVLVLSELFDAARVSDNQPTNKDRAKAMSALTGFSEEKIRQLLSNPSRAPKDIAVAQEILRQVGLVEMAEGLKRDQKRPEKK